MLLLAAGLIDLGFALFHAAFWLLRLALQLLWFDLRPVASRATAGVFALAAVVHFATGLL